VAKALALFFGEASPAKGAELFLAETSAVDDGVPFSWLFLSPEKNSGFANDLVQGHLRKTNVDTCHTEIWYLYNEHTINIPAWLNSFALNNSYSFKDVPY
jgi:hypothetical protein